MGRYADVDDILSEETPVPLTWRTASTGLGRALDPGAAVDDIASGTSQDLPLWLVRNIANRNMVELHTPSFLGRHAQRRLRAGAGSEDLQGRCPHFYDAAQHMAALTPADEALPAFVFATFQTRYQEVVMQGMTRGQGSAGSLQLQQRLSCEEAALFQAARVSVAAADRWHSSDVLSARARAPKRKVQATTVLQKVAMKSLK